MKRLMFQTPVILSSHFPKHFYKNNEMLTCTCLHSSGLPAEMPWPLPRSLPAWSMPAYMHLSGSKGLTTSPGNGKQGILLLKTHAIF